MARLSKYNEPTEVFSVKVPASKKEAVSKLVDEFLNQFLRNKTDGVEKPMLESHKSTFKGVQEVIVKNQPKPAKEITMLETFEFAVKEGFLNECGCYLDGKFMKRSKGSKCKKTKKEHNF